jgi:hypothetical protein
MGLDNPTTIVLDKLRKQRNVADYSGDVVPESATRECLDYAKQLLQQVDAWLRHNKPEFLS